MQEIFGRLLSVLQTFKDKPIYNLIDILIISILFYFLFIFLKKQNAFGVIRYIVVILVFFFVVLTFSDYLSVTTKIIGVFATSFFVIIVALYPYEFRRAFWKISSERTDSKLSDKFDCSDEDLRVAITEITRAVQNMSKRNTGALLVFANNELPNSVLESGTMLNSVLSCALLESIFITKGPLHDGAVVIWGNKVVAAGCFLPLSQNLNVPKELGTRHRAAIGISEACGVTSLTVSEETGIISAVKNGQLYRYFDTQMLTETMEQIFGLKKAEEAQPTKKRKKKS